MVNPLLTVPTAQHHGGQGYFTHLAGDKTITYVLLAALLVQRPNLDSYALGWKV